MSDGSRCELCEQTTAEHSGAGGRANSEPTDVAARRDWPSSISLKKWGIAYRAFSLTKVGNRGCVLGKKKER